MLPGTTSKTIFIHNNCTIFIALKALIYSTTSRPYVCELLAFDPNLGETGTACTVQIHFFQKYGLQCNPNAPETSMLGIGFSCLSTLYLGDYYV